MAGATIDVSPRIKIDIAYRFLNYGTVAMTPDPAGIAIRLKDMRAHEGRFGLRYLLGGGVL
jgi:opacity protein-like surface antigen